MHLSSKKNILAPRPTAYKVMLIIMMMFSLMISAACVGIFVTYIYRHNPDIQSFVTYCAITQFSLSGVIATWGNGLVYTKHKDSSGQIIELGGALSITGFLLLMASVILYVVKLNVHLGLFSLLFANSLELKIIATFLYTIAALSFSVITAKILTTYLFYMSVFSKILK